MDKKEMKTQTSSETISKIKAKKISRRLLIKILLMSLVVVNSMDNLEENQDELNQDIKFKKFTSNAEAAKYPQPNISSRKRDKSRNNRKPSLPTTNPEGSDKPSPKGEKPIKPSDPAPGEGSTKAGGKG
jgi:hypothetical protein